MAARGAKMSKGSTEETELVIAPVFDAPRELVFDAWTKAEHLQHWEGAPRGFTTFDVLGEYLKELASAGGERL
jgi:uncharacterized protein YndB with AHSA1/START domain